MKSVDQGSRVDKNYFVGFGGSTVQVDMAKILDAE